MMSESGRQVFLLPPLPRLRDWWLAGATAGLCLGFAELGVAFLSGASFPSPTVAALLATSAATVSVLSGALGMALRSLRMRASYSQLVGAVVGPQALVVLARPLWIWLGETALPGRLDLLHFAAGAAVAVLAGLGAARFGQRGERTGTAASGPLVWGASSILLAGSGRLAATPWLYSGPGLAALFGAALVVALLVFFAHRLALKRGTVPRASFARMLFVATAWATAIGIAPSVAPWLLLDAEVASIGGGPPNVLVVALSNDKYGRVTGRHGLATAAPTVGVVAWNGVAYEPLVPTREGVAPVVSPLALSDGSLLPARLDFEGFATAQIARNADAPLDLGTREVDARPGSGRVLREAGSWMSVVTLLSGPASPLMRAAGLAPEESSVHEVVGRAERWLLNWRTRRAATPFFLFVDLRGRASSAELEEADSALASLLDHLEKLEADMRTFLLIVLEGRPGSENVPPLMAVVRPPLDWPLPGPGTVSRDGIPAEEIALTLAMATQTHREGPVALPGVSMPGVDKKKPSSSSTSPRSDAG